MNTDMFNTRFLDRTSILRSDETWINSELQKDSTRIIPIYGELVLCDNSDPSRVVFLTQKYFNGSQKFVTCPIFLGMAEEISYFAINIQSNQTACELSDQMNGTFQDFKSVMSLINAFNSELLALARFVVYWHSKNQYCGKCGGKTEISEAGHLRTCENYQCNERYYPNMDPAIIVMVTSGEQCLLGRQKEWREGVYSTLAGFVEPGETIEEAVIREVQEEAGILVGDIQYRASQPWLFPNSLMLGFTAIAKEEKIVINKEELEDIRWFTREEVNADSQILPYKSSIAYELILEWLKVDKTDS